MRALALAENVEQRHGGPASLSFQARDSYHGSPIDVSREQAKMQYAFSQCVLQPLVSLATAHTLSENKTLAGERPGGPRRPGSANKGRRFPTHGP